MHARARTESALAHRRDRGTASRRSVAYAESRIMPNRDSETSCNSVKPADAPSCYLAPCGIVQCASEAMEEAQHLPSGRLTIFPFSWSASPAPQPTTSARLVSRPVKNVPRRMSLANPLVGVFGIRSSAGARLCRIAEVRKSSRCYHGAVIRHIPEFGIAPQVVRRNVLQACSLAAGSDHVPDNVLREAAAPHLPRLATARKILPAPTPAPRVH